MMNDAFWILYITTILLGCKQLFSCFPGCRVWHLQLQGFHLSWCSSDPLSSVGYIVPNWQYQGAHWVAKPIYEGPDGDDEESTCSYLWDVPFFRNPIQHPIRHSRRFWCTFVRNPSSYPIRHSDGEATDNGNFFDWSTSYFLTWSG